MHRCQHSFKNPSNLWVVCVGSNSFHEISYAGKPKVVSSYIISNLWIKHKCLSKVQLQKIIEIYYLLSILKGSFLALLFNGRPFKWLMPFSLHFSILFKNLFKMTEREREREETLGAVSKFPFKTLPPSFKNLSKRS